ncbi:MAG: prolyl oligopeptidase family serine peptidase, partial [Planctomycetes bacterium]|nr:prolyl oligopeptidase family serine peptidase [Planctomycetota bacterium]
MKNPHRKCHLALAIILMVTASGCVVGQPPGKGKVFYLTEAKTGNGYYLYLPEDYIRSEGIRPPDKKWPMVVTFHGMRPFDSAGAQIMEWQQEADRYGYVVIAPNTRISDLLGEIPIRRISSSIKKDELGTLAILDEVCQTLDVDPNHVLTTSWSMGGYLAHYMINRHPDRFSCLAVRQSNFSSDILDSGQVPAYRDSKIAIFFAEHDFNICRRESRQAIAWYTERGFDTSSGIVTNIGHERTPQLAAAFFAKTCGASAKTPSKELAKLRLTPVPPARIASARPKPKTNTPPARRRTSATPRRPAQPRAPAKNNTGSPGGQQTVANVGRKSGIANAGASGRSSAGPAVLTNPALNSGPVKIRNIPAKRVGAPERTKSSKPRAPRFNKGAPDADLNPLIIRLSAHIGISPMLMSYTVHIPSEMRKGAEVLWIDNGEPITRGSSG